jgi:hypothetical protein
VTPRSPYDLIVVTDASEFGWGALAIDTSTGVLVTTAAAWRGSDLQWDLSRSTESEPLGILKALLRFVVPAKHRTVLVLTDHSGVLHALRAGHGRSFAYNYLAASTARLLPGVLLDVAHIAGAENPVDAASRGQLDVFALREKEEIAVDIRRRAKEREAAWLHGPRRVKGHGVWMV